jgi:hypothetical protein
MHRALPEPPAGAAGAGRAQGRACKLPPQTKRQTLGGRKGGKSRLASRLLRPPRRSGAHEARRGSRWGHRQKEETAKAEAAASKGDRTGSPAARQSRRQSGRRQWLKRNRGTERPRHLAQSHCCRGLRLIARKRPAPAPAAAAAGCGKRRQGAAAEQGQTALATLPAGLATSELCRLRQRNAARRGVIPRPPEEVSTKAGGHPLKVQHRVPKALTRRTGAESKTPLAAPRYDAGCCRSPRRCRLLPQHRSLLRRSR